MNYLIQLEMKETLFAIECFQSYEYIEDYHFKRVEYEKVVNRVANFHKISKRLSQAIGTIRVAIVKEYRGYN